MWSIYAGLCAAPAPGGGLNQAIPSLFARRAGGMKSECGVFGGGAMHSGTRFRLGPGRGGARGDPPSRVPEYVLFHTHTI